MNKPNELEFETQRIVASEQARTTYKAYNMFMNANWYEMQSILECYNELDSKLDSIREKQRERL